MVDEKQYILNIEIPFKRVNKGENKTKGVRFFLKYLLNCADQFSVS